MKHVALALAIAAVAVAAPRLVLIFLEADSLTVETSLRKALLGASGAALALVLTGGGAYLVHAIVRIRRFQGLLMGIWVGILTCIAVLVTPRLVAGLRLATSPLAEVLSTEPLRWGWSIVAVLAGELVATGCMLAYAAQHHQQHEHQRLLAELERVGRQRNRLQQRLHQMEQRPLAPTSSEPAAGEPQAPAAGEPLAAAAGSSPSNRQPGSNGSRPDEHPVPCRYGCGYVGHSAQAERGHLNVCPKHPKRLREEPSKGSQAPSTSATKSQDDTSGA